MATRHRPSILGIDLGPAYGGGQVYLRKLFWLLRDAYCLHAIVRNVELYNDIDFASSRTLIGRAEEGRVTALLRAVLELCGSGKPDLILLNGNPEALLSGLAYIRNIPCIAVRHTEFGDVWMKEMQNRAYSIGVLGANAIVAVSKAVESELKQRFPGKRICGIPHWIDDSYLTGTGTLESPATTPVRIGIPARLDPLKGHRVILEACRAIAGVEVHLAGGGPDRASLQQFIADRSIGNVVWWGFVKDMRSFYNSVDIVGLASATEGGNPLALLEAMAMAKPVVASNIPTVVEIVEDGQSGLLCAPDDVGSFRQNIQSLVASSTLRKEMGQRGLAYIRSNHTDRVALARYDAFFREVMST